MVKVVERADAAMALRVIALDGRLPGGIAKRRVLRYVRSRVGR